MSIQKTIILAIAIVMIGVSCSKQDNTIEELRVIAEQLKLDSKHQFLKTLMPAKEDLDAIFNSEDSRLKIQKFSESRWKVIDQVNENSMKPETDDATLVILAASKEDLDKGVTNGMSEDYLRLSSHLKDGIKLYGIQYLNADGTEQKKREVFFKIGEKWIIIPRAFVAFEQ